MKHQAAHEQSAAPRNRADHVGEFHIRAGSIKLGKCSTLIRLSFNEQAEK